MREQHFDAARAAALLERFRARQPRVHCITNSVAEHFTANVLLAAGAVPSMTIDPEEVPHFTARADALLINLGTLDPLRRAAIAAALKVAGRERRPWALDPVFVERSEPRLRMARELLASRPTAIRANAAEVGALAGGGGDEAGARSLAESAGSVVAMSGEVDLVTDGERLVKIANGHILMGRITAAGCAATAILAGFLALTEDALHAAAAALAVVGIAAEQAGAQASGPGSFVPALLDALYSITPQDIATRARLS